MTWHRVMLQRRRLDDSPLPGWAVAVLSDRSFHTVTAKVIVATELFIALGLCWRATRLAAVWVAVWFHVSIQLSASVEVFSFLAVAALVIWAVPSTRDRVLVDRHDRWPRRADSGPSSERWTGWRGFVSSMVRRDPRREWRIATAPSPPADPPWCSP